MLVTGFPAGTFQTNCWLVAAAAGSEALVVDPGQDALAGGEELCRRHRLKPGGALVTHGHLDPVWTAAPPAGPPQPGGGPAPPRPPRPRLDGSPPGRRPRHPRLRPPGRPAPADRPPGR